MRITGTTICRNAWGLCDPNAIGVYLSGEGHGGGGRGVIFREYVCVAVPEELVKFQENILKLSGLK